MVVWRNWQRRNADIKSRQGQDDNLEPRCCWLLLENGREHCPAVFTGLLGWSVRRRDNSEGNGLPWRESPRHEPEMVYMRVFKNLG